MSILYLTPKSWLWEWRKWAGILGGGADLDALVLSRVCHHLFFGGLFHCFIRAAHFRWPELLPPCQACPQSSHSSCSSRDTEKVSETSLCCFLLSQASSPSGWHWTWFLQDTAMESFHFSFCNCCLLDCKEHNVVYNTICCNWLYNLRNKITLHCAKIKCSHWLLVIFPSRIIYEGNTNLWLLIPIGTIFQNLWKSCWKKQFLSTTPLCLAKLC